MRPYKLLGAELPVAAHLALGGLVVMAFCATFMDLGVAELVRAGYVAAVSYVAMNLCLAYLREHNPVAPKRVRITGLAGAVVTVAVLTVSFQYVMGYSPLTFGQTDLALATGVFMLFFGAFVGSVTNPKTLRVSRDPRRPYARVAPWVPTWRAATLPMIVVLAVVYVGSLFAVSAATTTLGVLLVASVHVIVLVRASQRPNPDTY